MERIVVGIDGSPSSHGALRWAVEEARARGAAIRAVHAWTFVPLTVPPFGITGAPYPSADDVERLRDAAQKLIDSAVDEVVGEDGVEIERVLAEDPAADALITQAGDADLLVVGSRGLGGFTGLLLGSVSHQVVSHAPCPVVVVRGPKYEG
jgi:nucleotide-binding universal stress UspA family protein